MEVAEKVWKCENSFSFFFFLIDCMPNAVGAQAGGGGGTLIFSHIRRLGPSFGFKILNFNIFWGFQKNEYFLGYEDFVDIFLGSSQNWASLRVISMQFF